MRIKAWAAFLTVMVMAAATPATALEIEHDLTIVLDPSSGRLTGVDMVRIVGGGDRLTMFLSSKANIDSVVLNNKDWPYRFSGSQLQMDLPPIEQGNGMTLRIAYSAVFDDDAPMMPVNTDNPGYGVTGTIGEQGALLLAGAGWYPHVEAGKTSFRVRVEAPAGIVAVTAGRSLGHETEDGKTVSEWRVDHPVRGLSLSAGPYRVQERRVGDVVSATYFTDATADLSSMYLDATARYLRMYTDLFGPYPFPKFAVVENFFPTGYGFPSYTLIGGRVLRLPFIIHTSLGHEIAHCWWGNGVHVDYDSGNWSEGLTSYVAEYLYKEQQSAEAAREHRRQMLRNFTSLVSPSEDFPLDEFVGRNDPVTQAVGYNKSAMVFHMLRQDIGDAAFWDGLRDLYRDYRFKTASWDDFRRAFEGRAGRDLGPFFRQWVHRKGAPLLRFESVSTGNSDEGQWVVGKIVQDRPYFTFKTEVELKTAEGVVVKTIPVSGETTDFQISGKGAPTSLTLDPDHHLFRRLHPAEMPPMVNSIKGSDRVAVVLAEGAGPEIRKAADILGRGMGFDRVRILEESNADLNALGDSDLILMGRPQRLQTILPNRKTFQISEKAFTLNGETFTDPADVFFGVFPHPENPARNMALLLPLSERSVGVVARKLSHYGKYSYLAFHNGQNRMKGVWPVTSSPLKIQWPDGQLEDRKEGVQQ